MAAARSAILMVLALVTIALGFSFDMTEVECLSLENALDSMRV